MSIVTVDLSYEIKTGTVTYKETTTARKEAIGEILEAFVIGEIGQGVDESPATEQDVYNIRLDLDLTDDSFRVTHDCGNKGLRTGILIAVLKDLPSSV